MRNRLLGLAIGGLIVAGLWWSLRESPPFGHVVNPGASQPAVVVLDPGINEVMIALKATEQVVGRPDYSASHAGTASVPPMGTGIQPHYEAIVRASPTLILTHGSHGTVQDNLSQIAPTHNLPWLTVEDVIQGVKTIGTLVDREAQADALARSLEEGLASRSTAEAPRVLVLLAAPVEGDTEFWYVKPSSLHGAAVRAAGGRDALKPGLGGPPSLSIEGLLAVDPDIIVVLVPDIETEAAALEESRAFWNRFAMLRAVEQKRVAFMVGEQHFSTGPGILAFRNELHATLQAIGESPR